MAACVVGSASRRTRRRVPRRSWSLRSSAQVPCNVGPSDRRELIGTWPSGRRTSSPARLPRPHLTSLTPLTQGGGDRSWCNARSDRRPSPVAWCRARSETYLVGRDPEQSRCGAQEAPGAEAFCGRRGSSPTVEPLLAAAAARQRAPASAAAISVRRDPTRAPSPARRAHVVSTARRLATFVDDVVVAGAERHAVVGIGGDEVGPSGRVMDAKLLTRTSRFGCRHVGGIACCAGRPGRR